MQKERKCSVQTPLVAHSGSSESLLEECWKGRHTPRLKFPYVSQGSALQGGWGQSHSCYVNSSAYPTPLAVGQGIFTNLSLVGLHTTGWGQPPVVIAHMPSGGPGLCQFNSRPWATKFCLRNPGSFLHNFLYEPLKKKQTCPEESILAQQGLASKPHPSPPGLRQYHYGQGTHPSEKYNPQGHTCHWKQRAYKVMAPHAGCALVMQCTLQGEGSKVATPLPPMLPVTAGFSGAPFRGGAPCDQLRRVPSATLVCHLLSVEGTWGCSAGTVQDPTAQSHAANMHPGLASPPDSEALMLRTQAAGFSSRKRGELPGAVLENKDHLYSASTAMLPSMFQGFVLARTSMCSTHWY